MSSIGAISIPARNMTHAIDRMQTDESIDHWAEAVLGVRHISHVESALAESTVKR